MKANLGNLGRQVKGTEFKSHSFALGLWVQNGHTNDPFSTFGFEIELPITKLKLSVQYLRYLVIYISEVSLMKTPQ